MSSEAFKMDASLLSPNLAAGPDTVKADTQISRLSPGAILGDGESITSSDDEPRAEFARELLSAEPLPAEAEFYRRYSWCLNAFPTLDEVIDHIREEMEKFGQAQGEWQRSEIITNIFLLCCSLADTVDDYLLGDVYDFSKAERMASVAGPPIRALSRLLDLKSALRGRRLSALKAWRTQWGFALTEFLQHCLVDAPAEQGVLWQDRELLSRLLERTPLPRAAKRHRIKIPAFFRSRDFAPADCFELSRKFVAAFPEDGRATLVVGLRTAGSFLAPLSCAFLRKYRNGKVDWVTIRPSKALTRRERLCLEDAAREKARAVVADESIHSGHTLAKTIELLRRSGFADRDIVVLNPAEPAFPDWKGSRICRALPNVNILTLEPAERYKQHLLDSPEAFRQLEEYFAARGYAITKIVNGEKTGELNIRWSAKPPERVDIRLKRIYEVHLRRSDGGQEIRFVLAKSVGWGWLSYHGFLSAEGLRDFVPPLLGLREGILYLEWIPQRGDPSEVKVDREFLVDRVAAYIGTRAQALQLNSDPIPDLVRELRHKGVAIIADSLRRAHSSRVAAVLSRGHIQRRLANQGAPPVLTDSKMSAGEWIVGEAKLLKTDFEHHGQGKNELGMTDPAFDLAAAIFHFRFSEPEAERLIEGYVDKTGDTGVKNRLYFNKLLVGLWEQNLATLGLHAPNLIDRREESHQQYTQAWNFLITESIRECGKLCPHPSAVAWKAPLVVTDIDGVLDRMVFGFPSATAAGIKAISLLHAHGFAIAANTARSLEEVKQYCRSYGFAGGLAEYGGVLWDAVNQREIGLVDPQSLAQLAVVRDAVRQIPGTFINDDYRYSLRAFTYQDDRTSPLPSDLAQDLLAKVGAKQLKVHQTGLDTAIVAKETDKGTGLEALLRLTGVPEDQVIAIGDSEPDLAMFRVAASSYAPAHIVCQREARLLGCHIACKPYQPGLFEIAQRIVHADGGSCEQCRSIEGAWTEKKNFFVSLLQAADVPPLFSLMRNFSMPEIPAIFRK